MARLVALTVTLLCGLAFVSLAAAEPPAAPTVVIVVEGVPLGAALRQRLARQFGGSVVSVAQAAASAEAPAAVVGVRYAANDGLAVAYLDRLGRTEVLSIAVSDPAAIRDVAFGMASALLARHLPALTAVEPTVPAARAGSPSADAALAALAASEAANGWSWPQWYAPRRPHALLSLDDF